MQAKIYPPNNYRNCQPPSHGGNVVPLRPGVEAMASPFDRLTTRLVLERHRAGTLDVGIVAALLAGCGVRP